MSSKSQSTNVVDFLKYCLMTMLLFVLKQPPELFCKKGVLKNLAKFMGKDLARVSFLIKLLALGLQLYYKRDSATGVFL